MTPSIRTHTVRIRAVRDSNREQESTCDKMKLNYLLALGATLALPSLARAAGGVEGSVHDFSTNSLFSTWNTRHTVCTVCHAAHNTDPDQLAPLWAHATTTNVFTPYSSDSIQFTPGQPSGVSLACLSCHDGSLAINQGITGPRGGGTNATQRIQDIDPAMQIGANGDLHVVHPISFTYDSTLHSLDPSVEDPTVYKIGDPKSTLTVQTPPVSAAGWQGTSLSGQTIDRALLDNGKMECSSCHDVHRLAGNSPSSGIILKISGTDSTGRGDLICRTCHAR